MATGKNCIRAWFENGAESGYSHLIVVCDTFDWEDYPVYVTEQEDARQVYEEYQGKNMQKGMEVYNLKKDMEEQLAKHRNTEF